MKHTYNEPKTREAPGISRIEAIEQVLGPVDWINNEEGFCTCPGVVHHTKKNGKKDCKVFASLGTAPTVYCHHKSCKQEIEETNFELRSLVGRVEFHSKPNHQNHVAGQLPKFRHVPKKMSLEGEVDSLANQGPWIQSFLLPETDDLPPTPNEHFKTHLGLFNPEDLIWQGDTFETSKINSVSNWLKIGKPSGNFISHSTFKSRDARRNENVEKVPFLVVESDELSQSEQSSIFAWLRDWAGWNLKAVIDTAGKSLHGWFEYPSHLEKEQIKALLNALKCDDKMLTPSQPCRVAGASRGGKIQWIKWLGPDTETEPKEWSKLLEKPGETLSDESGREWAVDDLLQFDIENDPNNLIGKRWLCRSGSVQLVGESGIGKSSFMMQLAVSFSISRDLFGITPIHALRVLIVQRENDEGDMSEELQGINEGLSLSEDERALLKQNLKIIQNNTGTGMTWANWIEDKIVKHKADLVIVDPLLSFCEGDISRQADATLFLRQQLQPVLNRTKAAVIAAHHTGKPKSDKDKASSFGAESYLGLGSSEFTNYFRGVMTLTRISETGKFSLKAAKRGKRAGLVDYFGNKCEEVILKHAEGKIFWEYSEPKGICKFDGVFFRMVKAENDPEEDEDQKPKGKRKAKAKPKESKPSGRPSVQIPDEEFEELYKHKLTKESKTKIAKKHGVSERTVYRFFYAWKMRKGLNRNQ